MINNLAPKITVLMPVYNGEKYLRDAIESVLNQTYKNFEFIIINDGSTDNSRVIIESYSDNRIILINNKSNIKLIKSLNMGLEIAKGKYVARMDCDDICSPDRLCKQLSFLEKNRDVCLIGSNFKLIDSSGKFISNFLFPQNHNLLCWSLCFYSPICHPSVMFRKDVVCSIGGYNMKCLHAEDYDLWYRLSKNNKIANLPDFLLYLRKHQNNVSLTNIVTHKQNANKINQYIVEDILCHTIETEIIENIRNNKYRTLRDQACAILLILKIYNHFDTFMCLSPLDLKMINIDVAKRIFIIAVLRIYDIRVLPFIFKAFRFDKFLIFNLIKNTNYGRVLSFFRSMIRSKRC